MDELKKVLDKITEIKKYDAHVFEQFAKGKKPPIKFSEEEIRQIEWFLTYV